MDIVKKVLMLMRATKENDLDLHVAALYELCPLSFAPYHNNYTRYIPVYLLILMNLDETQSKAVVSSKWIQCIKVSFPRSRNAVDRNIEQTINRHAKTQGLSI